MFEVLGCIVRKGRLVLTHQMSRGSYQLTTARGKIGITLKITQ